MKSAFLDAINMSHLAVKDVLIAIVDQYQIKLLTLI